MTNTIKFLTFNMQAAIATQSYTQYVSHSHRQIVHAAPKRRVLLSIATLISDYDIVCLQEVDLGGRRAGFTCQAQTLKEQSGHSFLAVQENRVVGNISRHGNATLSRFPITEFHDIKLPGRMPGRGCLISTIERNDCSLVVANLHLSLGKKTQDQQLDHIAACLSGEQPSIIAGDFNCTSTSGQITEFSRKTQCAPRTSPDMLTYPSWKPRKSYDHILTCNRINTEICRPIDTRLSDHLPVEANLRIW